MYFITMHGCSLMAIKFGIPTTTLAGGVRMESDQGGDGDGKPAVYRVALLLPIPLKACYGRYWGWLYF